MIIFNAVPSMLVQASLATQHSTPRIAPSPGAQDLLVDGCQVPALDPGPYLARLRVLSADWGLVFNSAALLREQAPALEHLYAMAG